MKNCECLHCKVEKNLNPCMICNCKEFLELESLHISPDEDKNTYIAQIICKGCYSEFTIKAFATPGDHTKMVKNMYGINKCYECGEENNTNEGPDQKQYCDDCWHEKFCWCENCNDTITHTDSIIYRDKTLCKGCYNFMKNGRISNKILT